MPRGFWDLGGFILHWGKVLWEEEGERKDKTLKRRKKSSRRAEMIRGRQVIHPCRSTAARADGDPVMTSDCWESDRTFHHIGLSLGAPPGLLLWLMQRAPKPAQGGRHNLAQLGLLLLGSSVPFVVPSAPDYGGREKYQHWRALVSYVGQTVVLNPVIASM